MSQEQYSGDASQPVKKEDRIASAKAQIDIILDGVTNPPTIEDFIKEFTSGTGRRPIIDDDGNVKISLSSSKDHSHPGPLEMLQALDVEFTLHKPDSSRGHSVEFTIHDLMQALHERYGNRAPRGPFTEAVQQSKGSGGRTMGGED